MSVRNIMARVAPYAVTALAATQTAACGGNWVMPKKMTEVGLGVDARYQHFGDTKQVGGTAKLAVGAPVAYDGEHVRIDVLAPEPQVRYDRNEGGQETFGIAIPAANRLLFSPNGKVFLGFHGSVGPLVGTTNNSILTGGVVVCGGVAVETGNVRINAFEVCETETTDRGSGPRSNNEIPPMGFGFTYVITK